jgi:hypothetical protein
MLDDFSLSAQISDGRSSSDEMLFTPVTRSTLSSLSRNGIAS